MQKNKICLLCKIEKAINNFGKRSNQPDGYFYYCKSCKSQLDKAYREKNREKLLEAKKAYYTKNRDKHLLLMKKHYAEKSDEYKTRSKKWKQKNAAVWNAKCMERYTAKINRKMNWDIEFNDLVLNEAYDLAKRRSQTTDFKWHVDHIVPLRSKLVSGLHTWTNIAVIPASENCSKKARYWPDMW